MTKFSKANTLAANLLPDEHIVWEGKPYDGLLLRRRDFFLVPFSLLWGSFILFWNVLVGWQGEGGDIFFRVVGLVLLGAALYFVIGRFYHDRNARRATVYAVTNQRALILCVVRSGAMITSFELKLFAKFRLVENDVTKRGSILFDSNALTGMFFRSGLHFWTPSLRPDRFEKIDHAAHVFGIMKSYAT